MSLIDSFFSKPKVLLVTTVKKSPTSVGREWSRQQKRAFSRLMSGLKAAEYRKSAVYFLTLTTSEGGKGNDLMKDFGVLVKRIRRGEHLKERRKTKFEYCLVRTEEGNGVLHLLFYGTRIRWDWLKAAWSDIHKSIGVWVRQVWRSKKRVAGYIAGHYMAAQRSLRKFSWSWKWVFKGWVRLYRMVCVKVCHYENGSIRDLLEVWNKVLYDNIMAEKMPQSLLLT